MLAKVTDPYERQARLYPALLAGLPLIVTATILYGSNSVITAASTVTVSCGGLYLLANIARERGRRLEPILYEAWGGKPTTQLLRHRDRNIEGPTKRRYHEFLSRTVSLQFPSETEEESNPVTADDIYQSAVRWLLNQTRDVKKFKLLYQENISYGFRRNALGLKPIGLALSFITVGWVLATHGVIKIFDGQPIEMAALMTLPPAAAVSVTVSALMAFLWAFYFTQKTVRTAAFAYAESLLRACDILK